MAVFDTGKGSFGGTSLILGRLKRIPGCKDCINIVHFCRKKRKRGNIFQQSPYPQRERNNSIDLVRAKPALYWCGDKLEISVEADIIYWKIYDAMRELFCLR